MLSADEAEAACESLLARRVADHPRGVGGSDYGPVVHKQIEHLCKSLIAASDRLPVLHYATHIDGWAMGNHGLRLIRWPDGRARAVLGLNYGIAWYPSRHAPALLGEAAKWRRRQRNPFFLVSPWYANALATAIQTGLAFKFDFVVAVIAECLGPTRECYDIEASLRDAIPGVSKRRRRVKVERDRSMLLGRFSVPTPSPKTS